MTTPPAQPSTPAPASSALNLTVRSIAAQLNKPSPMAVAFVKGVVTAVSPTSNPPSCSIQLNGDTSQSISGVLYFDTYFPVIGDVCVVGSQGTDIVIIGQLQDTASPTARGWQSPALAAGFTNNANSMGVVQYRLVNNHGEFEMQWRGGFGLTASATSILAAPLVAPFVPSGPRYRTARRDSGAAQLNDVGIDFNTNGTVTLEGYDPLLGIGVHDAAAGGGNTGNGNGGGTGGAGGHSHGASAGGSDTGSSGVTSGHSHTIGHSHGIGIGGVGDHTHGEGNHSHSLSSHTHGMSVTTGGNPAWISLVGVHYFI